MNKYQNDKPHAFRKIEGDIKKDQMARAVLLCGTERFLVDFYAARLGKLYTEEATRMLDLTTLEGESASLGAIVEGCETLSMLSRRKVVLVPDFPPAQGKRLKGFSDKDVESLCEYIKDERSGIPADTLLILTAGDINGSKKVPPLVKAMKESKVAEVYDFQTLDDSELRGFIDKRLRASGKQYRPSIVSLIISECGYGNKYIDYTLYNLENDLKKIVAHAAEEIVPEDVKKAISPNPENNTFKLIDNIAANRKGAALELLHNLFDAKTEPFLIQAMIVKQLEEMLITKEMTENGYSVRDISGLLKDVHHRPVPDFRIRKALGFAKNISYDTLKHMLTGAYEIDRNVKKGVFDPKLALEYYISNN